MDISYIKENYKLNNYKKLQVNRTTELKNLWDLRDRVNIQNKLFCQIS